jgi:aspartate oxidase
MVKMPFEKKNSSNDKNSLSEDEIKKLIDKGAPVKADLKEEELKKWTNINLRIALEMLKEIDAMVNKNVGMTRTSWILQTLQKELKRMNKQENPNE